MNNFDGEKLWAYLDAKFLEFSEEYAIQSEMVNAEKSYEMPAIIIRTAAVSEKINFIIQLRNEILSGRFFRQP